MFVLAKGKFFCLFITNQGQQDISPDLDLNCLTLESDCVPERIIFKKLILNMLKKVSR